MIGKEYSADGEDEVSDFLLNFLKIPVVYHFILILFSLFILKFVAIV